MARRAWALARAQHWVVTRTQLLDLGFTVDAIRHRLDTGRLHPIHPGVYAVGRRHLTNEGRWMAAVLACGHGAFLSHESAATLWGISTFRLLPIRVSVPQSTNRNLPGVELHRRSSNLIAHVDRHRHIPASSAPLTLVDLANRHERNALEAMINAADRLDLADPDTLRRCCLGEFSHMQGVATLRNILDRHTFILTDSELERRFLPLARAAGLPKPETQGRLNGFRVDFYWPDLKLVVETDGLRYHRTPAQQARDRLRDQAHVSAGLVPLRFTHAQVRFEPEHVKSVLRAVTRRLRFD